MGSNPIVRPKYKKNHLYFKFSIVFYCNHHKSGRINGPVVELVDTLDLGSSAARFEGSSPFRPTIKGDSLCLLRK